MSNDRTPVETAALHDGNIFVPGIVTLGQTLNNGLYNGATVALSYDDSTGLLWVNITKGGAERLVYVPQTTVKYMVLKA